jgi:hypothetical protein
MYLLSILESPVAVSCDNDNNPRVAHESRDILDTSATVGFSRGTQLHRTYRCWPYNCGQFHFAVAVTCKNNVTLRSTVQSEILLGINSTLNSSFYSGNEIGCTWLRVRWQASPSPSRLKFKTARLVPVQISLGKSSQGEWGLLPNNGSNNVTKSNCFNCCVPKLLGNRAYSNSSEPQKRICLNCCVNKKT